MEHPRCLFCLSVLELHAVTVEDRQHGAHYEALALMCHQCEYVYELPTALPEPVLASRDLRDDDEGLDRCWMCDAQLPPMLRARLEMCAACQDAQDRRWPSLTEN